MRNSEDVWLMLKTHKVIRIELKASADPEVRRKTIHKFKRRISKLKSEDNNYKRRQPNATLSSKVVSNSYLPAGTQVVVTLEFELTEIPEAEEI